jgi:hypothetical protein
VKQKEREQFRELKEKRREELRAARVQKKEMSGGWTVVLKKADPASTAPVAPSSDSAANVRGFHRDPALEIKVNKVAKGSTITPSESFPVDCVVTLTPAGFADSQNRKGTIG